MQPTFCVVVIPDGNRRSKGHEAGYLALKHLLPHVWDCGITHFGFWALSVKNFYNRSEEEIAFLKNLLYRGIKELGESPEFIKKDIRFIAPGGWRQHLAKDHNLWLLVDELEQKTRQCQGPVFALLLVYNGKEDIFEAVERVRMEIPWPKPITFEDVGARLLSRDLPDVDLVIRTGERKENWTHLSENLLPWQMCDPQMYSTKTLWPEFTREEFDKIICEFKTITRRRGA